MRFSRLIAAPFLLLAAVSFAEDKVAETVNAYLAEHKVVGASVAVMSHGNVLYANGFGFMNKESKAKATEHTVYRLASVSKPLTAIAAMQLVEKGKLSLDGDATKFAPLFPKKKWAFSLRHLLTHTSGIRHYMAGKRDGGTTRYNSAAESLVKFKDDELLYEPGTNLTYSTHAFTLVAYMIEAASGLSFGEYMQKYVFDPADAQSMALEAREVESKNRSELYDLVNGNPIRPILVEDLSWKYGGGGYEASALDVVKVADALIQGKLTSKKTLAQIVEKQSFGELSTNRALGWVLGEDGTLLHGGSQQGARSMVSANPETGLVICVLTNTSNHDILTLFNSVQAAWAEQDGR